VNSEPFIQATITSSEKQFIDNTAMSQNVPIAFFGANNPG
jgi:hypothetical protein